MDGPCQLRPWRLRSNGLRRPALQMRCWSLESEPLSISFVTSPQLKADCGRKNPDASVNGFIYLGCDCQQLLHSRSVPLPVWNWSIRARPSNARPAQVLSKTGRRRVRSILNSRVRARCLTFTGKVVGSGSSQPCFLALDRRLNCSRSVLSLEVGFSWMQFHRNMRCNPFGNHAAEFL